MTDVATAVDDRSNRRRRLVILAGLVVMVLGAVDPLEGSLVILAGLVLAAIGAHRIGSRWRRLLWFSLGLMALGVGALWWLSSLGGFGGDSGRSNAWGLLLVPYPVGWLLGLSGAVLALRERQAPGRTAAA